MGPLHKKTCLILTEIISQNCLRADCQVSLHVRKCIIQFKDQEMKQSESESSPQIIKITNSQNTKRTYGELSEQLFPKRWPLSSPNRAKII